MILLSIVRAALCALALLSIPAFAIAEPHVETTSPPVTATLPSPSPIPLRNRARPRLAKGRISWSITPDLQYETESDLSRNGPGPYSFSRIGWHIGYDILPRLTAYWTRGNIDSQFGRVFVNGKAIFPTAGLDLTDEIGLAYAVTANFSVSAGYFHRARQCCPGAGDPTNNNPIQYTGPYVGLSESFGPNTVIGKPFSVTVLAHYVDHHLNQGALASLTPGTVDHGKLWTIDPAIVTARIPIAHQRRVVPSVSWIYFGTYFDNAPVPLISTAIQYGLTITGSPLVDYSVMARTFNQYRQGTPFPEPQGAHYSWLQFSATFHGRL